MTLFLQGWWSYPKTEIMDRKFFLKLDKSRKLLYIPTAMVWWYTYDECYEYISNITKSLWVYIKIESYPYLDKLKEINIKEYSWVYIWWGNTFKLLHEIKKNWIDDKLINFLKEWWLVCWWSAWAIIFWKNINTSQDANIVSITDISGMNLVKWLSVRCHYREKQKEEIKEYVKYNNINIIALPETSGIEIENDLISIIWDWEVVLYGYDSVKIYKPWDILW